MPQQDVTTKKSMQSRDGYTSSRNIQKGHPKEMKSQYPQIYKKNVEAKISPHPTLFWKLSLLHVRELIAISPPRQSPDYTLVPNEWENLLEMTGKPLEPPPNHSKPLNEFRHVFEREGWHWLAEYTDSELYCNHSWWRHLYLWNKQDTTIQIVSVT